MPNEMTAAEAAENPEETLLSCNLELLNDRINNLSTGLIGMSEKETMSVNKKFLTAVRDYMGELLALRRRIAAGEYRRVVYCDDCVLLDRSPCPARDPETGKTRNCVGYCRVGALMDGKDKKAECMRL